MLSYKGTVYSTKDLGKNWDKLRDTFQKTGKRQADEEENVTHSILPALDLLNYLFMDY